MSENTTVCEKTAIIPWQSEERAIAPRNEKGQFLKGFSGNEGNTSTGQAVAAWFRRQLEDIDPRSGDGKCALQKMFESMLTVATNDWVDEKGKHYAAKESVWAFNALMERAYGPAIKDKSELDAIAKQGGVQIQILQLPALPASSQPQRVKPVLKPEFDDDGYEK